MLRKEAMELCAIAKQNQHAAQFLLQTLRNAKVHLLAMPDMTPNISVQSLRCTSGETAPNLYVTAPSNSGETNSSARMAVIPVDRNCKFCARKVFFAKAMCYDLKSGFFLFFSCLKRKPSFANELGIKNTQPRTQLPQTCTLITKEKLKKGCSLCLNTSGSPNHTRRTGPKFTKFGSSTPLSLELLQSFEEKAPTLLRTNEDFDVSSILPAIPKNWQHVVITDEFLAGQLRVCEIIGLDQIGEIILTPPTFVLLGSLRERFKLNMSKPQAKKIMILALGHSAPQTAQVCPPQLQGLQNNLENIPPEKIILI